MKNTKQTIKITSLIISSIGLLYIGLVTWVKLSDGGPLYLNPCYNTLITRPLAWLSNTEAQYKMGMFYARPLECGEKLTDRELDRAIYWFGRAAEQRYLGAWYQWQILKSMANYRKYPSKKGIAATDSLHANLYEIERLGIRFHVPTEMRVQSVHRDTTSLSLTLYGKGITLELYAGIGYLGSESFDRYHKRCLWESSRDESSVVYHFSKDQQFTIGGRSRPDYSSSEELLHHMKFVRTTSYIPYYKKNCQIDTRIELKYAPLHQDKANKILKYFAAFPYDCEDVPRKIVEEEYRRIDDQRAVITEYLKTYHPTVEEKNRAAEKALDEEIEKTVKSLDTTKLSFYHSSRFGLSLRVPRFMELDNEQAYNNDGLKFHWNGDAIQLWFAGHFYEPYWGEDPWEVDKIWYNRYKEDIRWYSQNGYSVSYKFFKDNWYVLSGRLSNGRIYYYKRVRASLYSYHYETVNEISTGVWVEYDPKYQTKAEEIIKYFATFPYI